MKKILSCLLIGLVFGQSLFSFTLIKPLSVDDAVIKAASATLSNPRRSYYASVSGPLVASTAIIPIKTSGGTGPETTVAGLFPGDTVVIGPNGDETVASIPSTTGSNFVIDGGLNVGASDNTDIIATQSGTLTVAFTIGSAIPANGYVELVIPDPPSNGNDGKPDYNATLANLGFDANGIANTNTTTSGGTGCTWSGTETFTAGTGAGHTYSFVTTTQCTAGTITMTVGDGTTGLVNPARVGAIGSADVYQMNIYTKTSAGVIVESRDVSVAIVEGVLVSANVDETLSFTVAGRASGTTSWNIATLITTTATTVPWGVLSTTYAAGTHNAAQQLTLSTNSSSGYKVYAQENDQMGLNGNTCTGAAPSAGEYTFVAGTCIRDIPTATHTTAFDWGTPGTNYGLGYSLENATGTPAQFLYNDSGTFYAKQFADKEVPESETDADAQLMVETTGPVAANSVYVCFRINIPGDQPSGYYYNIVKYTAVPIF